MQYDELVVRRFTVLFHVSQLFSLSSILRLFHVFFVNRVDYMNGIVPSQRRFSETAIAHSNAVQKRVKCGS